MTNPTDNNSSTADQEVEIMIEQIDRDAKDAPDQTEAVLRQIARNLPETDACIPKLQKLYRAVTGLEHPFEDDDRAKYGKYLWDEIRNWIRDTRNDQRLDRADALAKRADEHAAKMATAMYWTAIAAFTSALMAIIAVIISMIALSRS